MKNKIIIFFHIATLLFLMVCEGFYIHKILDNFSKLEKKTAWVQQFKITGQRAWFKDLEIWAINDTRYLRPPIHPNNFTPNDLEKEYIDFIDTLSKKSKLEYHRTYPKAKFGDQIYYYVTGDKSLDKKMVGYHLANEEEPSKYRIIMDLKKNVSRKYYHFIYTIFIYILILLPKKNDIIRSIYIVYFLLDLIFFYLL